MPEQLSYTDRYNILSGRTAFVKYVQQQIVNGEVNRITNHDASYMTLINDAKVYTTTTD